MRFRSSNPILRNAERNIMTSDNAVTYSNVAFKTIFLVAITGFVAYLMYFQLQIFSLGYLIGAMIVGFISAIVGTRSVSLAPYFAVLYAACEGIVLGMITIMLEVSYPGIAFTAISTTLIVLFIMMLLYSTNIIKVNQKFASFMVVALISIIVMSVFMLLTGLIGGSSVSSGLYLGIAVLSTIIAALYLFMDFENIKRCVEMGADTKYGWILSLGLMVTLVWLYVEILRLLAIFARRNN
ncbi:MAG: hypothetical protein CVV56_04285 [Tenericutes bacterium HGW-Tenericutes-1]|nr:MAG: hypothetical protein CVV56_04285 [Tenericutes bacterium HGW-Tenericutes-1]